MKNMIRSALSDPDEPRRTKINRKRYAGDVGNARPRSGSNETDDLSDLGPEEKSKIEAMIDVVTDKIMEATSLITGRDNAADKPEGKKGRKENASDTRTHKEAIKEEDEESAEDESTEEEQDEEKDQVAQMKAYEESLRQKRLQNAKKEELNSRYSKTCHSRSLFWTAICRVKALYKVHV